VISLVILLKVYSTEGVGWDFVSQYLNARTMLNPGFYSLQYPINDTVNWVFNGYKILTIHYQFVTTNGLYFEKTRGPISSLVMALTILASSQYSIQIYILLALLFLLFAILFVSKKLNLNPLILSALLLSPYIIRWTVLQNGNEILSLGLALISVGLLVEERVESGISLALVGLAKYTNLMFAPLIVLLHKPKKIATAVVLFIVVTLPWLIFYQVFFGNMFLSYFLTLQEAVGNTPGQQPLLSLLSEMLAYPVLVVVAIALLFVAANKSGLKQHLHNAGSKKVFLSVLKNRKYSVCLAFFFLSLIGFIIEYRQVGLPERFGYPIYAAIAIFAAFMIESRAMEKIRFRIMNYETNVKCIAPYALFALTLIMLFGLYLSVLPANHPLWLGPARTNNPMFISAVDELKARNLSDCMTLSNGYAFLNYYNVVSETPFACTPEMYRYPFVAFRGIGENYYCRFNLTFSFNSSSNANYTIYLPENYTCVRTH
jgi:hypothetical protein